MNEGTMHRFLGVSLLVLLSVLSAGAQEGEWKGPIRLPVWAIDADGEFVTIVYGLSEAAGKKFDVGLQLANVEQRVLAEPDAVTGHIGTVTPGPTRKIIWHYRKDYPSGLRGRGWKFILTIEWGRQKVTVATREGTFTPPRLLLEKVTFTGAKANAFLDAGEQATLSFVLRNVGMGDAVGTCVRLALVQPLEGMRFDTLLTAGDMLPGSAVPLQAAFTGLPDLQTGSAKIQLSVRDRYDYSVVNDTVTVATQAFLPPALVIVNRSLTSPLYPGPRRLADAPMLVRGDTGVVMLEVKNLGRGKADSIRAAVAIEGEGWNAHFLGRSHVVVLRDLPADSSDVITFPILADERAEAESIRVLVGITERRAAYGLMDTIRLPARRRYLTFDAQFADLMKRGLFDSAGVLCRRQLTIEPHRATLYADLGDVYDSMGDRARAVEQFVAAADRGDRRAASWLQVNATFKENTSVRYESTPLPFLDAGATVTIGVFPSPVAEDDPAGERLYSALRANTDRKRVVLVPYKAMTSQLGAASILSSDSGALRKMSRDLGITYVIEARDADRKMQGFTLSVVRTADAQGIFARKFQPSAVSTALQDLGRLFKESLVPVYTTKRMYSAKAGRWK
jgi:hypothetical protein